MRISHVAIYASLSIQGRGALKREPVTFLRTGRALHQPIAQARNLGYEAVAISYALIASMSKLPEQLRKTLTWARGKEHSATAQLALATDTTVVFAGPLTGSEAEEREHQRAAAPEVPLYDS